MNELKRRITMLIIVDKYFMLFFSELDQIRASFGGRRMVLMAHRKSDKSREEMKRKEPPDEIGRILGRFPNFDEYR